MSREQGIKGSLGMRGDLKIKIKRGPEHPLRWWERIVYWFRGIEAE